MQSKVNKIKIMIETDKYQEAIEDEPTASEKKLLSDSQLGRETTQEVPPAEKKIESAQKPGLSEQAEKVELPEQAEPGKDLSAEALAKEGAEPKREAPAEAVEPKSPTDDSPSAVITEEDKALRAKKIEEIKKLSQEEQIKALCNLAFEKDIDFAAETAKGLNDAYVLDEFHDKLDKLNLVKKGKLKEI